MSSRKSPWTIVVSSSSRDVRRQPLDQRVHRRDVLGFRGEVLLRPAVDLAREVVPRLAVGREPHRLVVHRVEPGERLVHRVVDREPLAGFRARQQGLPQHAALDALHDEEHRPYDRLVSAQAVGPRHRHVRVAKRGHHPVLAVHRVCRGQQLARRLAAQHVALAAGFEQVGGAGLPALELPHLEFARETSRHAPRGSAAEARCRSAGAPPPPWCPRTSPGGFLRCCLSWRSPILASERGSGDGNSAMAGSPRSRVVVRSRKNRLPDGVVRGRDALQVRRLADRDAAATAVGVRTGLAHGGGTRHAGERLGRRLDRFRLAAANHRFRPVVLVRTAGGGVGNGIVVGANEVATGCSVLAGAAAIIVHEAWKAPVARPAEGVPAILAARDETERACLLFLEEPFWRSPPVELASFPPPVRCPRRQAESAALHGERGRGVRPDRAQCFRGDAVQSRGSRGSRRFCLPCGSATRGRPLRHSAERSRHRGLRRAGSGSWP